MKKLLLTFSLSIFITIVSYGQVSHGEYTYGGTNGNYGSSIIQTKDGGYISLGTTGSYSAGSWDIYVIKLDAYFNVIWTKIIGGSTDDEGYQIIQTSDSGYAIAGITNSYGAGNYDVYVIKLDAAGNVKWTRTVGGPQTDYGYALTETYDKGLAIVGSTNSFGAGNYDMYVIKLDSVGNLKWTKTIGGTNGDAGNSIVQTPDYGLVIVGSYGGSPSGMYVVKLDSTGGLMWAKVDTIVTAGYSVINTFDKGLIVTGYTGDAFAYYKTWAYMLKLDSLGSMQWNTMLGDTGTGFDTARGTLGTSAVQVSDSGFIITGYNYSYDNGSTIGEAELMFMKTDSKGKFMWDTQFDTIIQAFYGNDGYYSVPALCATKDKGCAAAWLDWGKSKPMKERIVKLDSNGTSCTGRPFPIYKTSGAAFTTGGIVGSGGSITTVDSGRVNSGGTETTICSIITSVNSISSPSSSISVYPNPSNGKFQIQTASKPEGGELCLIKIYNALGVKIYDRNAKPGSLPSGGLGWAIDLSGQPNGIYLYRMLDEEGKLIGSGKLLIDK